MTMNTYPIPSHPSWEVRDSSKLSAFRRCPRKYFYEHLLGWRSEYPDNNLWFGESVHKGLEVLTLKGFSSEALVESFEAFNSHYRKEFSPETDDLFKGKTPSGYYEFLKKYVTQFASDPHEYETLYTEISGSVPISYEPERRLFFRMDSILRRNQDKKIISREHKTTGLSLNEVWKIQHELSIQIGTYTHVLYCIYDPEEVLGVEINGMSFRLLKAGPVVDLERVPCYKNSDHMQVWLWSVNDLWEQLDFEMDRLAACEVTDEVMTCFPMKTEACTDFFRKCAYHDFCCTWRNPLQKAGEIPLGFKVEFWNPTEMDTRVKMELGKEGESK